MKEFDGKDVKVETSNGGEIGFNNFTLDYDSDFKELPEGEWNKIDKDLNVNISGTLDGLYDINVEVLFDVLYLDEKYIAIKTWIKGRKDKTSSIGCYKRQEDNSAKSIDIEDLPEEGRSEVLKEVV